MNNEQEQTPSTETGTPRTDDNYRWVGCPAIKRGDYFVDVVSRDFARTLESDLATARRERDDVKKKGFDDMCKAVENLAGGCATCAEIGFTGMSIHEHDGCVVTRLRQAESERDAALAELATACEPARNPLTRRAQN